MIDRWIDRLISRWLYSIKLAVVFHHRNTSIQLQIFRRLSFKPAALPQCRPDIAVALSLTGVGELSYLHLSRFLCPVEIELSQALFKSERQPSEIHKPAETFLGI
jgi:hypothetical protein